MLAQLGKACSSLSIMANVNNFFGRVGKDISAATDITQALSLAGLAFDVTVEPVKDIRDNVIPSTFNVARIDTGESMGVNGARYTPVQTSKAFAYMDDLAKGVPLTYHRGGLLKGGRFFVSVEFDSLDIKGDIIRAFGVFLSSFDGTWANRFVHVFSRNRCMNICGYTLRKPSDGNAGIAAKHTANVETKLDNFVSSLSVEHSRATAIFTGWADAAFTLVEMEAFAKALFPKDTKASEKARETLVEEFSNSALGAYGKTKWDAFNAVTAFETHHSTRRNSTRASAEENAFDALVSYRTLSLRAAELLGQ